MSARELVTGGIVLGAMGIAFATVVLQNPGTDTLGDSGEAAATTSSSAIDNLGPGLTTDSSTVPGESAGETSFRHSGCGSY